MKGKVKARTFVGVFLASLLVLGCFLPSANAITGWHVVSHPKENSDVLLESVCAVSRDNVWAVGWLGTILHWDGTAWQIIPCPVRYYLFSVQMVRSTDGWIVGEAGTILRWDGATWKIVASPTSNSLNSVSMVNSNDGWAVGAEGTIIRWDGSTWTEWSHTAGLVWNSVCMHNSTDGWIVGSWGNILHWTGKFWDTPSFPSSLNLNDVFVIDGNNVWAVGESQATEKYTIINWNGTKWNFINAPPAIIGATLHTIYMLNKNDGWAAGYNVIMHWDGSTWSLADGPSADYIYSSLIMLSSGEGWGVGVGMEQVGPSTFESLTKIFYYGEYSPSPPKPPFDVIGGTWLSQFKNIYVKTGSSQNIALFEDCAATTAVADSFQSVQQGGSYEFALYVLNVGTAPVYVTYLPTDFVADGGQTRFHVTVNVYRVWHAL